MAAQQTMIGEGRMTYGVSVYSSLNAEEYWNIVCLDRWWNSKSLVYVKWEEKMREFLQQKSLLEQRFSLLY